VITPAPVPVPSQSVAQTAAEPARLSHPRGLPDMLLYRINQLRAVGGGMVLRYCEGQFGVTRREWVVLALLAAGGPAGPSELAVRAGLPKPAMSKALVALQRKGLISRAARRGDRRYAQLALTAAGEELHGRILPVVDGINRQLMAPLTEGEIAVLDGLLARMQERASEMARTMHALPPADRRHGGTARGAAGPGSDPD
jgi:DNA-binding MarR family transcriptional regulator